MTLVIMFQHEVKLRANVLLLDLDYNHTQVKAKVHHYIYLSKSEVYSILA